MTHACSNFIAERSHEEEKSVESNDVMHENVTHRTYCTSAFISYIILLILYAGFDFNVFEMTCLCVKSYNE